ncbi:FAS1 domain-containing protein [Daedalea quercina L-15889]|uniref:FAS1 domain-containing protein n=1 Tax=Daedalea quercina L-15889 TaxID=1314783 RepID=A0A165T1C4_9APHY|nr:FAS1 domain-containing protein [Daedalea quercina L-15889]
MRPWLAIPFTLLYLVSLAWSAQVPVQAKSAPALSTNILDVLSADPDYVSLIKLLQTAKLIPTLNRLSAATLFAPTNDAIAKHALWRTVLATPDNLGDNIQEELRQQLFYHILNYTIPALPTELTPQVHKTLLYPRTPTEPPTREPPPGPPWMPIPGGTLGGESQRLRAAYREDAIWIGTDALGKGGAQVVKEPVKTSNGVVIGVNNVLEMPADLETIISQHPSLSYFANVLTQDIHEFLNSTSTLTLFLPVNAAWEALPHYERLYLQSKYATDDLTRIVNMHAVTRKHVKYSESFASGLNLTTLDGSVLEIVPSENSTVTVSGAQLTEPDIYASNGAIHAVSSLLVREGALRLTPEKYLLTLNCSTFVSLLHSVSLESLVNDTEAKWTILAPSDDVMNLFGDDGSVPKNGTEELRRTLRYHFIPGKWGPDKLKDGMLLETALEEDGLSGDSQVLAVEVSGHGGKTNEGKTVRFGGAGTIRDHVEINNTLIYFVSRPLVPPADALQTALPELDLSTFLAAIFSTSLAEKLKTTPRITLLMPPNSAFKRLGMLVSAHLLAASSRTDLERVIEHHALRGVEYGSTMVNGSQRTFATLEGSDVQAERTPNGSVILSASGGWAGMQAALVPRDLLTQTGVIHEVSDIMIPRSVQLTIGKLVKAAKGSTMATMMTKAGLDWVLNGTAPPADSPWAEQGLTGSGWTLLCPTDDAFKQINLTALYADQNRLRAIVSQHLIPSPESSTKTPDLQDVLNNNRPVAMGDSAAYKTLQTRSEDTFYGDIVFRIVDDEDAGTIVGVDGAHGDTGKRDWARVLSWGRATAGGGTGGVVQIDRLLVPYYPPWYLQYGAPIAVGVLGVILIGGFFYGVRVVWRKDTTEATYEPIGGFVQEDGEEP